jgi:hypothetical protein
MGSSPDGPGTLHVSRPFPTARGYDVEYHPEHDGRSFDSAADKDAYCLKHGLIKVCTPPAPGKE